MKFLIIFFSSFLFANELYIHMLENNIALQYLQNFSTKNFVIKPKIKKIIQKTPNKFVVGSIGLNTIGDKKASIGIEFDFHKKNKTILIANNKKIFNINHIFNKQQKVILCYKNMVLFNLKQYLLKVKHYDNFYSQYLVSLSNINPCYTFKKLTFFNLKKEKKFIPQTNFILRKKREISSNLIFNINQKNNTYLSASFNIKIPLEKTYSNNDISKLQNLNNSLNKIYLLIININNEIDSFNLINKKNIDIIKNIKLLTLVSKVAPTKINFDKLINLYKSYFDNLLKLNQLQKQIFINKFLLKTQKRIFCDY